MLVNSAIAGVRHVIGWYCAPAVAAVAAVDVTVVPSEVVAGCSTNANSQSGGRISTLLGTWRSFPTNDADAVGHNEKESLATLLSTI